VTISRSVLPTTVKEARRSALWSVYEILWGLPYDLTISKGPHIDCACTNDQPQCPEGDDILACDECGGATEDQKCKGLEDQNNKWKDCDCIEMGDEDEGYNPFSDSDYDMWDRVAAALPPVGSEGNNREHPSGNPTCGGNQVDSIPSKVKTDDGEKSPQELQYMMREGELFRAQK
jgi:hypothetical protein